MVARTVTLFSCTPEARNTAISLALISASSGKLIGCSLAFRHILEVGPVDQREIFHLGARPRRSKRADRRLARGAAYATAYFDENRNKD